MSVLDIFNNDIFGLVSMTKAIADLPVTPSRLGRMGLFRDVPVNTLTVGLESRGGRIVLIPTAARGTMPNVYTTGGRKARFFGIPHIPLNSSVMADDVQGIRSFDSEDATEAVSALVNNKLEGMKQSMEATWEWHRVGAISGLVKDADGTTELYDLFDEFGLTETEVDFDMADEGFDVKSAALEVVVAIEDALGPLAYTNVHAMCGADFYSHLIHHPEVLEAFADDDSFVRNQSSTRDTVERGFEYGGVVWERYPGKMGTLDFIPAATARFFPVGVSDLFERYLAPAEFEETVNTLGRDIYVKQKRKEWDLGVDIHVQSNPLHICNRPATLVKGTDTGVYS